MKKKGPFNIKKLAERYAKKLNKKGYYTEVKRRRGRYPSYNVFYKKRRQ
ncbi:hypothetical protein LCGC14_1336230 [marine sediment metagenome]|uniref:Uncharacterized protein n=1 Tax=marine sediment metagenome TaxID=412755 RepID=A0A0F9KF21_9ZZZZ